MSRYKPVDGVLQQLIQEPVLKQSPFLDPSSMDGLQLPRGLNPAEVPYAAHSSPNVGASKSKTAQSSFAIGLASMGAVGYASTMLVICNWDGLGDTKLKQEYAKVDPITYQWPMLAFATAFALNFILVLYERGTSKFQLAVLACYINALACCNDYLSWRGVLPIARDSWGQGLHIGRHVMWLYATVSMVYILSVISDFTPVKVYTVMALDAIMILTGILGGLFQERLLAIFFNSISFITFFYVVQGLWGMFSDALSETKDSVSRVSLKVLRGLTMIVWSSFPIIYLIVKAGVVDVATEEMMWAIGDLMGKIMFSTSLLQGNFLTIEQRRLLTMRAVEEANRVQVIQELKELVEQKEHFISGISHELRTPLNGIIGLSEAILVGSCGQVNEVAQKAISTIKISGGRLLNLINDILDAAAMRQGKSKFTIKHEKVLLQRIVDDVIDLSAPLARKGVELTNLVPQNLPAVLGDASRIIQILHNLVGNACKFTHKGKITVEACCNLDEVEASVTDTGIGIPQDKFKQVFEAFEQVDMSTTRKYGGTGLGLNLVKQLVDAHGGTINVKSKQGVGTRFSFTLKLWEGNEPPEAILDVLHAKTRNTMLRRRNVAQTFGTKSPSPTTSPTVFSTQKRSCDLSRVQGRGSLSDPQVHNDMSELTVTTSGHSGPLATKMSGASKRSYKEQKPINTRPTGEPVVVLSVDDDPVNQMVIENLLGPAGYQVTKAMDGVEAMELLEDTHNLPDIILLDIMMPGMSGYEVCRRIREQFPDWCVPIIMVSARSKEEDIVEGLACGANDYVVKPFGRQEILARISAHLRAAQWVPMNNNHGEGEHCQDLAQRLSADTAEVHLHCDGPGHSSTSAIELLTPYLSVVAPSRTLPTELNTSAGHEDLRTTLHGYNMLTLVMWKIANVETIWNKKSTTELAAALSGLHMAVDALAEQCNAYLVESPADACSMALCGLKKVEGQANNALDFAAALLEAAQQAKLPGGEQPIELCVAVHTFSTDAVVVGVARPVLHATGQLVQVTGQLLRSVQPGCVHVSEQVYMALEPSDRSRLHPAGALNGESTYLLRTGAWQDAVPVVASACTRLIGRSDEAGVQHCGPVRLGPLQRALIDLVRTSPAAMLHLGAGNPHLHNTHGPAMKAGKYGPGLGNSFKSEHESAIGTAPDTFAQTRTHPSTSAGLPAMRCAPAPSPATSSPMKRASD